MDKFTSGPKIVSQASKSSDEVVCVAGVNLVPFKNMLYENSNIQENYQGEKPIQPLNFSGGKKGFYI